VHVRLLWVLNHHHPDIDHVSTLACFRSPPTSSTADIKQYIGWPTAAAIYEILRSCILELARKRVISTSSGTIANTTNKMVTSDAAEPSAESVESLLQSWSTLAFDSTVGNGSAGAGTNVSSLPSASAASGDAGNAAALVQIAQLCAAHHFSGRTLRKLPFQAHARHCRTRRTVDIAAFLRALHAATVHEIQSRAHMGSADAGAHGAQNGSSK
jgi:hypothetical protein